VNITPRRFAGALAVAALCVVGVALPFSASAAAPAAAASTYGPMPALIVSGLGKVSLSPHIARPGQTITATFSPAAAIWTPVWPVKGCKPKVLTCRFKAGGPTGWTILDVSITNNTGYAHSQDAYAVVPKDASVIQGFAVDKAGAPIAGAKIVVTGINGTNLSPTFVTTGSNGFYDLFVKPGDYSIVPSGGLAHIAAKYSPASLDRTVTAGATVRADFTLQEAIKVTLRLNHTSVRADGYQIVQGTISTTYGGKPAPNVSFSLWPKESELPAKAVSSGVRATICDPGGNRIWPTGSISQPDGFAPSATTDAHGHYAFTLTVGTVPGQFEITAWAKDALGALDTTDLSSVTSKQTLTVTALGNASLAQFRGTLNGFAMNTPPQLANLSNDPDHLTQALAALTQAQPAKLGGLAYATVSAGTGGVTLVYPAATPPDIATSGSLGSPTSDGKPLSAWALSPSDWTGITTSGVTLAAAIDAGSLQVLPTFTQWASGASGLVGWTLKADSSAQPYTGQFHYYGYGYPNTAAGACF
jgi:hypothetical protein